jgi:pimeloyl-ACP methyl ester carboxylesterase
MAIAELGEVRIYYEEQGEGDAVLLAAPSWWPCDTWKVAVVPALSRRYRTIIFDCRGSGYSSKPAGGYTIAQFAADAIALLEHLNIRRCHAVGFALGGQIVQAIAIERPDLVATLTMAAVGAGMKANSGAPRGATADEEREIHELGFERFIRGHVENTHMAFGTAFYREHPEIVSALSQALWERQTDAQHFGRHSAARRTWDTLGNAEKIQAPSLILCGADDEVNRAGSTPVGTARKLAERLPGAELVLIPGVKHMTFWDGTGALAALEDFLECHPIGPRPKRGGY